jgi:two-component system NtrC family sensor kinase
MLFHTGLLIVLAAVLVGLAGMTRWYARAYRRGRSELEGARERVRGAEEELVGAARLVSLGTLVAGVTHEISTPLGAIRSNRDMLRRVVDKLEAVLADGRVTEDEIPQVAKLAGAISGIVEVDELALERITGQVRTLRTFGCGETEEPQSYDVNQALTDAVTLLRHEIKNRVTIERDLGDIPHIECHPAQINQVLLNILLNACQAISGKGTIGLRTREADGDVTVAISDSGAGIPEERMDRIFKPGFTTKSEGVGMGLGLPISRHIVQKHGGRIDVQSQPGEGTTFMVVLPVRFRGEPAAGAKPADL